MKKLCLFAVALALCAPSTYAADLYVSLSTGKNSNAGTQAEPLKNLWKALEKAQPGDTIHIAEGLYPGKMRCGWFAMKQPVNLIGGYNADFSARDPLKYQTLLQPDIKNNDKKGMFGILEIVFRNTRGYAITIDGLLFNDGYASSFHATKGKPEGVETGMWLPPPAKGQNDPFPSRDRYMLYASFDSSTQGDLTIKNCAFVNGGNFGAEIGMFKGKVEMVNNIFVNNRMVAANVTSKNAKAGEVSWVFKNNTVLFTWSRLSDYADMGYGVRANTNVIADFNHNIFGLNVGTGMDNTLGNMKTKKIALDNNVFFLNKTSDVQMTMSPNIVKVNVDLFEDLEGTDGIESITGNIDLQDPTVFAGRINPAYLDAFLNASYAEATFHNPNSPANVLRSVLGLPQRGVMVTKVSMFANRYPFNEALRLFGAMPKYGAQEIK
ncbi:MAG: DUF1565 domain-containing protein [Burkholderiaceae bacterium]|nr:DUF1565 domain-containing protein [Burkholderiaceae bacterium]